MKKRKSALYIAVAGMVSAPAAGQNFEVQDLNVRFYGHINMAVMHAETGNGSEQYIVDNDYASSRVGGVISTNLEEIDLKVGAHIEYEYQHNPSNLVTPENRTIKGDFDERHLNLFAEGGFGKVSVGQGHGAADDSTEMDLSGTKVASFPDLALVGGALPFVDNSGDATTSPTLFQTIRNQDFEARYDRLRYDTPAFGPVTFSVSQGYKNEMDITEVAASYNKAIEGVGQLSSAIGYSTRDTGGPAGDVVNIGGSVSWLHNTGINMTVVYSNIENDSIRDSDFSMFKLGYKTGKHSFTIHRAQGDDFNPVVITPSAAAGQPDTRFTVAGSEAIVFGAAYVYKPIKRLDIYTAYNNFSLDSDVGNYDDVNIAMVGSRFRF
ncbi:porin [Marinobacter sp. ATCH36]|uniref:porin n=1 Tax=Marinobacter sp. ATCH36 TaxID=2945106 RepID=UPI0020221395|nr:porin [Marinobacter sp. ATCH36]MCL7943703.1 porin [Marinobacter sp. ATCH36]